MSGNTPVWYALQVFHRKGDTLLLHLERNWVKCFFPTCYAEHAGTSGKSRRSLLPATHDQLFVQYGQGKGPILAETLQASPYASRVYTKTDRGWCGICRAEMAEPHAASIRNLRGTVRQGRISGRTRRNARLRRPRPAQRAQRKVGKIQEALVRRAHRRIHRRNGAGLQVALPPLKDRYVHSASAREKNRRLLMQRKTPPNATRCVTMRAVNTPHQKKGEA